MYGGPTSNAAENRNNSFYNMAMQKYQTLASCSHLKFISVHIPNGSSNDRTTNQVPQTSIFETVHEIIKMTGNQLVFEKKPNSYAGLNCEEFSYDISYEGGGCLKLISKNIKSYHR